MESKNIIISPFSRPLRNGKRNPKDFPYWDGFVSYLKGDGHIVIQIGVAGEKEIPGVDKMCVGSDLNQLVYLLGQCDAWVAVDNFFHHLVDHFNKPGIVIFSQSDPKIYGHKQNLNVLKDEKYLREKQFDIWEEAEYKEEAFVSAEDLYDMFKKFITK